MSKFGLDPEEPEVDASTRNFAERLAAFPISSQRHRLDLAAVDAAAAPHGFVSREAPAAPPPPTGRRRRLGVPEPTRHLAIRLTMAQYDEFVAYADAHQLTYQDAVVRLLAEARQQGSEHS